MPNITLPGAPYLLLPQEGNVFLIVDMGLGTRMGRNGRAVKQNRDSSVGCVGPWFIGRFVAVFSEMADQSDLTLFVKVLYFDYSAQYSCFGGNKRWFIDYLMCCSTGLYHRRFGVRSGRVCSKVYDDARSKRYLGQHQSRGCD